MQKLVVVTLCWTWRTHRYAGAHTDTLRGLTTNRAGHDMSLVEAGQCSCSASDMHKSANSHPTDLPVHLRLCSPGGAPTSRGRGDWPLPAQARHRGWKKTLQQASRYNPPAQTPASTFSRHHGIRGWHRQRRAQPQGAGTQNDAGCAMSPGHQNV
jgi:hypothetical protein